MRERDAASRLNFKGMEWGRDVEDGGLRGWRKRDVQDVAKGKAEDGLGESQKVAQDGEAPGDEESVQRG